MRFCGVSATHGGMFVVTNPRSTELYRSWSVGSEPDGVERHLNVASVKSRGLGSIHWAFSPWASPSSPWQPAQYRVYGAFPAAACPVSAPTCASCAAAGAGVTPASRSTAPHADTSDIHRVCGFICGLLSEGEVEGEQQAAAPHLRRGVQGVKAGTVPAKWGHSGRSRHCEFGVQRHAVATEHERIGAGPDHDRVGG